MSTREMKAGEALLSLPFFLPLDIGTFFHLTQTVYHLKHGRMVLIIPILHHQPQNMGIDNLRLYKVVCCYEQIGKSAVRRDQDMRIIREKLLVNGKGFIQVVHTLIQIAQPQICIGKVTVGLREVEI